MIQHKLSGRYVVLECLGVGGFGSTYLAEDSQLPNYPRCVVKQLKPKLPLHLARRQFNTEAKMLCELGRQHDQIPKLYAHFEENHEFYLVQEFIEGDNLGEIIPGDRWSEDEVITFLQDILGILQVVHRQNVIHGDVKPANLIKRKIDGKIVLIDFGAVKQISTQQVPASEATTAIGFVLGTPGYMPNEQQGGKPRLNSDIYAVGVIAIQALTGLSVGELPEDSQTGELVWYSYADVSPRLATILDKMVRVHFMERYSSAEEILHDLQVLQNSCRQPDLNHLRSQFIHSIAEKFQYFNGKKLAIATSLLISLLMGLAGYHYLRSRHPLQPSSPIRPALHQPLRWQRSPLPIC